MIAACLGGESRIVTESDAGYAAMDAMVALLILASSAVMSLNALEQAGRVSDAALETRQAQLVLSWLLESGPRDYAPAAGQMDGFSWTLETRLTGADRPIEICRREARVRAERSGRRYEAATLETCPPDQATS